MEANDRPSTSSSPQPGPSMEANDRPSTSSSPQSGPSSSASGDQPDGRGQSRDQGKRKREETDQTDMPEDSKRSRVTSHKVRTVKGGSFRKLKRLVARGQYLKALAYTKTNLDTSSVSRKAKLHRYLQKTMISLITVKRMSYKVLGLDYADVMIYLLSERLEDYNDGDNITYCEFFYEFLKPDYKETLLKLVRKHTTNLQDKRRMLRIMFLCAEFLIQDCLLIIPDVRTANMPDFLQKCQKDITVLVPMLPANLHDESDPAMSLSWLYENSASASIGDYVSMFQKAVELQLVQEAKLLYDAGVVNNLELMVVARKPEIQKMLSNEEDHSEMAVFLRKVLKQPRCLESLALLQVSRLVGQDVLGREDRVRQLPLSSTLRDAILLRPQLSTYGKTIECNDQSTDGGV